MTAKTMAEVLAEHRMSPQDYAYCICGDELSPEEDGGWTTHEVMEAHQAAALSAAGFGLVADAKAEALEEAAALVASEQQHQWRRDSQRLPGAQIVAQRMGVLVNILRARAARAKATS